MRTVLLLVMAGITYWKIRHSASLALLIGALITAILAVIAYAGR